MGLFADDPILLNQDLKEIDPIDFNQKNKQTLSPNDQEAAQVHQEEFFKEDQAVIHFHPDEQTPRRLFNILAETQSKADQEDKNPAFDLKLSSIQIPRLSAFRFIQFNLFNQTFNIAGMAGPHNNEFKQKLSVEQCFEILYTQFDINVVIGLHDHLNFSDEACNQRVEYYHYPIPDFAQTPISFEIYDRIFEQVKNAIFAQKKVAIHCGAGYGRTGTVLAALKLRELMTLAPKTQLPPTEIVEVGIDDNSKMVQCSPLIKQAIEIIRKEDNSESLGNSEQSVETINDVETLIKYEKHLLQYLEYTAKSFATDSFDGKLYAGPHPFGGDLEENLSYLRQRGITKIYSLEEEYSWDIAQTWLSFGPAFSHQTEQDNIRFFISDLGTPSFSQLNVIVNSLLDSIQKGQSVYVHCKAGLGRTGLILAALYMKRAGKSADEAINFVRTEYHPHAIETTAQEQFLKKFYHSFSASSCQRNKTRFFSAQSSKEASLHVTDSTLTNESDPIVKTCTLL